MAEFVYLNHSGAPQTVLADQLIFPLNGRFVVFYDKQDRIVLALPAGGVGAIAQIEAEGDADAREMLLERLEARRRRQEARP